MKCPKCNTESGYVRSRKHEWVCRKCGTVTPLSKKAVKIKPKKDVKANTKAKKKK